ncbi:MAG: hypothetical protein KA275_07225 [Chitinophagaceae bacterium]|nr:hypothetical protein [Chitinophagaceae bacterium]
MKQVLLNIPEAYENELKQYIDNIPNATIVNQSDFFINQEVLNILDESSQMPIHQSITKETSNRLLKDKYGF